MSKHLPPVTFRGVLATLLELPEAERRLGSGWFDHETNCFCTLGACFPDNLKTTIRGHFATYYARARARRLGERVAYEAVTGAYTLANDAIYDARKVIGAGVDDDSPAAMQIMRRNDQFHGTPEERFSSMVDWLTKRVAEETAALAITEPAPAGESLVAS